jgi:glycosyltransferase involved in cell wall biosynthesis
MRVQVNGRYLLQRVTGVQRYAREIVARLADKVDVISPRALAGGLSGHLWEQAVLPWKLRRGVLWSPCATGPLTIHSQVVTIHDCAFFDCPEAFSPAFVRWYQYLVPRLARMAKRILTVSAFSRDRICELFHVPEEKVVVAPNGVGGQWQPATAERIAAARERLNLSQPYVMFVGSLEPRKNLRRLLAAWSQLGPIKGGLVLLLVGATGRVFRDADLGEPSPDVRLAGFVPDEDLPPLLSGAEAFVFPSYYEGFGLPVIEAMACGAPIVCSNSTALPGVVVDAAVLIDPMDVESIAAGLTRVLEQSDLRSQLRQRGFSRARQFCWDDTALKVWDVLASAL